MGRRECAARALTMYLVELDHIFNQYDRPIQTASSSQISETHLEEIKMVDFLVADYV